MEVLKNNLDFLLFGLQHYNIQILDRNETYIHLQDDYTIEIETHELFKLKQDDQVIAPFDDVEELCMFIKTAIESHEKS